MYICDKSALAMYEDRSIDTIKNILFIVYFTLFINLCLINYILLFYKINIMLNNCFLKISNIFFINYAIKINQRFFMLLWLKYPQTLVLFKHTKCFIVWSRKRAHLNTVITFTFNIIKCNDCILFYVLKWNAREKANHHC